VKTDGINNVPFGDSPEAKGVLSMRNLNGPTFGCHHKCRIAAPWMICPFKGVDDRNYAVPIEVIIENTPEVYPMLCDSPGRGLRKEADFSQLSISNPWI
jgi:hypothetical protein